jgi:heptaprenyl diphosphate synthase
MHPIWNNYPEIKKELIEVTRCMENNAKCKDKVIEEALLEMVHTSGKMLRPAFVVLAAKFGKYEAEKTVTLASVIELFHMATLVHDDVIDEATLRRGKPTVQSKYGKNYAVYIGDYLFCICFKLLASVGSLRMIQMDSRVMSRICLGEIEQLNARFNQKVSVKDYLVRISGKTAELFSLSFYIGAVASECPIKLARLFWQIGHHIGMAFQIIDDVLDYTSTAQAVGKDTANDIKDGLYTLPLIYALESQPKELIDYLNKPFYKTEDIEEVVRLTQVYGGVEKAKLLAQKYTQKAFKMIEKLPHSPYKKVLIEITSYLLERDY